MQTEYQRLNKDIDREIALDELRLKRNKLELEDEEAYKKNYYEPAQAQHDNTDELNDIYKRILALNILLNLEYSNGVDGGGGWQITNRVLEKRLARNKAIAASHRLPETQDASFGSKIRQKKNKRSLRRLKSDLNKLKKI